VTQISVIMPHRFVADVQRTPSGAAKYPEKTEMAKSEPSKSSGQMREVVGDDAGGAGEGAAREAARRLARSAARQGHAPGDARPEPPRDNR
jgi:hypothetical protein